ncbi:MAG TPA: site-specific DNA-methyltransferase [Rhizomicrobium sp.]|nr:site-specific DNA-methyltransferase [Rhizomicrobium sp.]
MTEQRPWPATEIELVAIETLVPYAANARTHGAVQVAHVADLMLKFGVTNPVLRDGDGTIIAGHARVRAALLNRSRGHEAFARLPVMTARGWSDAEKRAYIIADNQSALMAGWDFGLLAGEIQALSDAAFDTTLLGFTEADLRRLTGYAGGLTDPDAAPAVSAVCVSQPGDLWVLGKHRVLCGSATEAEDVQKLFAGSRPSLMVTDPPYGVAYDPSWRHAAGVSTSERVGKVQNDDRADWKEAWALFPGEVAYVWHAGKFAAQVQLSLEAVGFEIRAQIMWRKAHFAIGRGDYHWQHEPCWYAVRKGGKRKWNGDRRQSTVWDIAGVSSAKVTDVETADEASVHGTQKPVECMRRPIENNSRAGDVVYDPFLGSGTTIIAAEQCERGCYGIEIDPVYVDVVVRRWQNFTGGTATLSDSDSTFEQIEIERKRESNGSTRTEAAADSPSGAPGQ